MGFVSGLTGGVTLTLGLAYLTVLAHERNRTIQALHLRSQSSVLNSLLDPPNRTVPLLTRAEIARQERDTITERAKDRWNEEITRSVRFVQNTDWDGVRLRLEDSVSRLLSGGLEKSREGIEEGEKWAKPVVEDGIRVAEDAAQKAKDEGHRLVNDAAKGTLRGAEEAKAFAQRTPEMAKAAAEQIQTKGAEAADVTQRVAHDAAVAAGKAGHDAKDSIGTIAEQARLKALEAAEYAKQTSQSAAEQARIKAHEAAVQTQRLAREARQAAKTGAKRAEAGVQNAYDQTKTAAEHAGQAVHDAFEQGKDKSQELASKAEHQADKAYDKTIQAADNAGLAARDAYKQTAAKTQELADSAKKEAPGIIDSIRDTVRGTVTKGVEGVKEYVGAVQEAVAAQPIGKGSAGISHLALTAEEKALRQRYERNPDWIDQSVEQALAARYTPLDQRDNSILRGL